MGTQPALATLLASMPVFRAFQTGAKDPRPASAAESRLEVLRHFDRVFTEAPASTPEDIAEAFRLRYQVYCLDRGYESPANCPAGLEQDSYDRYALHSLLWHRDSAAVLGTVRLVLPPAGPSWAAGLPLASYAPAEAIAAVGRLPGGATAEVSRFAVTRSAREILKSTRDFPGSRSAHVEDETFPAEKLLPYMSLGLIRGLVRLSLMNGVTHWCLAAEPSLLRRLRSYGLHFENAGPLVDHRGLRQVCFANLSDLLKRAADERPEFWTILTEGGRLSSPLPPSRTAA